MCMAQTCKARALGQGLNCSKSSHHEVQLLDPSEAHLMTDAGQCDARVAGASHSHKLRGAANEAAKVANELPTVRSTYNRDGPRDCLRGASPTATEPQ